MTNEEALDEQALVEEIQHVGMHPQFSDIERRMLLAEARQAKTSPLLARLIVALEDADAKLRRLEEDREAEREAAYSQGWHDAREEIGR